MKIIRKQPEVKVEEQVEEIKKESIMMKIGHWSLKKKILVAAGAVGAAVVGVFAYNQCTKDEEVEYEGNSENDEENDQDDYDDEELKELEEMEQMEKEEQETKE